MVKVDGADRAFRMKAEKAPGLVCHLAAFFGLRDFFSMNSQTRFLTGKERMEFWNCRYYRKEWLRSKKETIYRKFIATLSNLSFL